MAYELLNDGVVTPYRLQALLRLVPRLTNPTRKDLYTLLQPQAILKSDEQDDKKEPKVSKIIITAALNLGFMFEDEKKVIHLNIESDHIETVRAFQSLMRQTMLGVTRDTHHNFLFNIFTAWYAVQDANVLTYTQKDCETLFNEQLYPDREVRPFNTTKFIGWRQWAVFLGYGWVYQTLLAPDATERIEPLLSTLIPMSEELYDMTSFMDRLADHCPELDGGELFLRCWEASVADTVRGNQVSLMLSTALRVLHDEHQIELVALADASTVWHLYHAEGHPINRVTHIRRRSTS